MDTTAHLLGLKVMRLTKPSLQTTVPVIGEKWDMLGRTLENHFVGDMRTTAHIPSFSTGEVLAFPQSFGMIFLGETFSGFVTAHNDSQDLVKEVSLKVELMTPSQRMTLLATPPIPQIEGGGCEERIITHEVKELGEHSLICSASYTVHSSGEEMYLRKFFKFNVHKPLDVKTKFHFIDPEEDILFEIQLQNITPSPMFLEVVRFDPAPGFRAKDLNTVTNKETGFVESVFGKENYLSPRNTQQYLYRITPLSNVQTLGKRTSVSVGKMDIVWRSKFGDKGRIQTGQLKANVPPLPELTCVLVESPGMVELEHTVQVTCRVTNNTDRPMRLLSQLERPPGAGLLFSGTTGKVQSELPGKASLELKLTLIPVAPGLQVIGPITFTDLLSSQKKYPFPSLGQLFVEHTTLMTA